MTIHPLTKRIGANVKALRKSKKITVRKLAAMCKLDYANLSRFENGWQDIRITTLNDIAEKLEVDIKELF